MQGSGYIVLNESSDILEHNFMLNTVENPSLFENEERS